MKALVQDGSGSADVLHLREIDVPAVADDRVLVWVRTAVASRPDRNGSARRRGQSSGQKARARGGSLALERRRHESTIGRFDFTVR